MKRLAIAAAAGAVFGLVGCAAFEEAFESGSVIGAVKEGSALYFALKRNGVVVDGNITRDEAPGYLTALREVFGEKVPKEYQDLLAEVCVVAADIETELDAESAALCGQ